MEKSEFPRPAVTVDLLVFRPATEILLIKRGGEPFKGCWALPGGYVEKGESLEQAAARELKEETGIDGLALTQLGAFGNPGRDPRDWTITVAFWSYVVSVRAEAGSDAVEAKWFDVDELPDLAFDHADIISAGLDRLREYHS